MTDNDKLSSLQPMYAARPALRVSQGVAPWTLFEEVPSGSESVTVPRMCWSQDAVWLLLGMVSCKRTVSSVTISGPLLHCRTYIHITIRLVCRPWLCIYCSRSTDLCSSGYIYILGAVLARSTYNLPQMSSGSNQALFRACSSRTWVSDENIYGQVHRRDYRVFAKATGSHICQVHGQGHLSRAYASLRCVCLCIRAHSSDQSQAPSVSLATRSTTR